MSHLDAEQLQDLALDAQAAARRDLAVAHVERCPDCRRALRELADAWSAFASTLPPRAPAEAVRARLLAEIEGAQRYAPFTARVARLFALDPADAAALLVRAADPASFQPLPLPGVALAKAESGAALGSARACLLRAAPGARYPRHEHCGQERVLEGGFRDDHGHEAHAGDLELCEAGSAHAFVVLDGALCVGAVVSTGPIRFVG